MYAISYICRGLTTPSVGVARALGLRRWIEKKAQMMVYRCLFKGTRVWSLKTLSYDTDMNKGS